MTAVDYSKWQTKKIGPTSLRLDVSNPRLSHLGVNPSQREIIAYLVEKENVLEVARSIAYKGYFPDELPIVTHENGKRIVLEGNRRVAACKILINPNLAPGVNRKKFSKLLEDSGFNIELIRKIKFLESPDRISADTIIENRHAGVQIEKWDKIKQYRFYYLRIIEGETIDELADKFNKSKAVIRKSLSSFYLYEKALTLDLGDTVLLALEDETRIGITNLERFYETKEGKEFLKIGFNNDGNYYTLLLNEEFDKRYKRIIEDFLSKKLTSRTLNDAPARGKYMQGLYDSGEFSDSSLKSNDSNPSYNNAKSSGEDSEQSRDNNSASANNVGDRDKESNASASDNQKASNGKASNRRKKKDIQVKTLIPSSFECATNNDRINAIVGELKALNIEVFPNAVSVLFRSLLDMSLHQFLNKVDALKNMKKEEAINAAKAYDNKLKAAYVFLEEKHGLNMSDIDEDGLKIVLGIKKSLKPEAPSLAKMLEYVLRDDVEVIDNIRLKDAFRPYYSKKSNDTSHWDFNRFVHNEYTPLPTVEEFERLWINVCHFLEYIINKLQQRTEAV